MNSVPFGEQETDQPKMGENQRCFLVTKLDTEPVYPFIAQKP